MNCNLRSKSFRDYITRFWFRSLVLTGILILSGCSAGIPATPDKLGFDTIEFEAPKPDRWELPNGLVVMHMYDDEIPLVGGKLLFPGGGLYSPEDRVGIASATGAQMREGGVRGLSPLKLDKTLNDLAASVESSFSGEYGTVTFSCLSEDFDKVFGLFSKVVRRPTFDPKRFSLWKSNVSDGILRRRDDANHMAGMAFLELIYGKNSPYAREASLESIKGLTRADMKRFHKRFVGPKNAVLAVYGAVTKEALNAALESYFGAWSGPTESKPTPPPVEYKLVPGIYVLERDFEQASVMLGHLGPPRLTKDQYAIAVYDQLFGHGGFQSTLFSEIRSKLGLAYVVWGGFEKGPVTGSYRIGMGTRATEVEQALSRVLELVEESRTELPPEKRFLDSKQSADRSFVFEFASTGRIVSRAAILEVLDYPDDYHATYLENLRKVTRSDVLDVAKRWVKSDELVVVVVGNVSAEEIASAYAGKFDTYHLDFDTKPSVLGKVTPSN